MEIDHRVRQLITAFENKGWTLIGSVDVSNYWWFEDIIQLTSNVRPTGVNIYLTLLTDPMYFDKKIVWCIGISTTIPENNHFRYINQVTLNDVNKTDLEIFVEKINLIVLK